MGSEVSKIKRGQIRLDMRTMSPVKIGNKVPLSGMRFGYTSYRVRDVVTGEHREIDDYSIGRELTEMEVVAWASK